MARSFSLSPDARTLSITIPRSWDELSPRQLAAVLRLMAHSDKEDADGMRTRLLLALTGLRPVCRLTGGGYLLACHGVVGRASAEEVAGWLHLVDFLFEPPTRPVRLASIGRRPRRVRAVDAELHGVEFRTWLEMDNYYTAYVHTRDPRALDSLVGLLYPGFRGRAREHELMGAVLWMESVKGRFSALFPHLFTRSGDGGMPDLAAAMNAQIRALTGGDVTREEDVLAADTWRALTELDAKAREMEDLRKRIRSERMKG